MAIGDKCPIGSSVTNEDFQKAIQSVPCYKNCSVLENEIGTGCVPGHFGGKTHDREPVARLGKKKSRAKKHTSHGKKHTSHGKKHKSHSKKHKSHSKKHTSM